MLIHQFNTRVPVSQLRREFDRLWGGTFGQGRQDDTDVRPPLNVWQDEGALFVEAELPGISLEDLDVVVEGDRLMIKGQPKVESEEKRSFIARERFVGAFSRTVRLPFPVDAEKIGAVLKQGILTITLPKAEAVLPKRIAVNG